MFKGVLFDLDGVITNTAEFHYQAWKKLAADLGFKIDRKVNEQLKGVSRVDSLKFLLKLGGLENSFNEIEFVELAQRKNDYYLEMIATITPEDIFPGIKALLTELKDHQVKIALASASKNGPLLLDKMNLMDYFDAIADPSLIKYGKPAPDIFLLAAHEIGISPSECIGIEDARAGITAIKASNALPIGIGSQDELGDDLVSVNETGLLTYELLEQAWSRK